MASNSKTATSLITALPIAYPLDDFYAQAGRPLPQIKSVDGDSVPEPFKSLLVHQNDMTPTLEAFYGERIHVEVMHRQQRDDYYFREVVLTTDGSKKPVEFGAIKINLGLFPPPARLRILEERTPLGTILADYHVTHTSRPKAFLHIVSDDFINKALKLDGEHVLYGRRNTLWDPQQRALAEIVEILPPA